MKGKCRNVEIHDERGISFGGQSPAGAGGVADRPNPSFARHNAYLLTVRARREESGTEKVEIEAAACGDGRLSGGGERG